MKRILIRTAVGAAGFLGLLAVVIAVLYGWGQSEFGRAWIAARIAHLASTPGDTEVTIGGIEGDLYRRIHIRDIAVKDPANAWLVIRNAKIRWSPMQLLRGIVDLRELHLDGVRIERLPAATDDGGPPLSGLQSIRDLPYITVRSLEVEDLALGASVLGTEAALRIKGSIQGGSTETISGNLSVRRTDGESGTARLEVIYGPAEQHLAVDLEIVEPAGGLIVRALGVPDLPAFQASINGAGPVSEWRGRLSMSVDNTASAAAEIDLQAGTDLRFQITGTADIAEDRSGSAAALWAGSHRYRFLGRYGTDGVLGVDMAEWKGEAFQITLDGRLNIDELTIDARASLRSLQGRRLKAATHPVAVDRLELQTTFTKSLIAPALALKVDIGRLAVPDATFTGLTGDITLRSSRIRSGQMTAGEVAGSGSVAGVIFAADPRLQELAGRPVDWKTEGEIDFDRSSIRVRSLSLVNALASISGAGSFSYADGTGTASLNLRAADMRPFGAAFGQPFAGRGEISLNGTVADFGKALESKVSGRLSGLEPAQPVVKKLAAGEVRLAGDITLKSGALVLHNIAASSDAASITLDGRVPLGGAAVKARIRAEVGDGISLVPTDGVAVHCRCAVTGEITGALDDPRLMGDLATKTVAFERFRLNGIASKFDLRRLASGPIGPVRVDAKSELGPLSLRTDVDRAENALQLAAVHFEGAGTTVDGAVRISSAGEPLTGDFRFKIAKLRPWLKLGGIAGDGAGAGRLQLSAAGRRQGADMTFDLVDVEIAPSAPDKTIRAQKLSVKAASSDLLAAKGLAIEIEATEAVAGDVSAKRIAASATGSPSRTEIDLKAAGTWIDPLAVETSFVIGVKGEQFDIAMSRLSGTALSRKFAIEQPFRARWHGDFVALDDFALALGDARLTAQGKFTRDALDATVAVARWPLATADRFWSSGLAGVMNGTLTLGGTRAAPTGRLTADIAEFRLTTEPKETAFGVALEGDWRGGRLALKARTRKRDTPPATIAADLPLRLEPHRWNLTLPQNERLSASAVWKGDTATLWKFLPFAWHQFSGPGQIDANLSGTYARPIVEGRLAVRNGTYESLQLGTVLKPVDLAIDFDGSKARLTKFTARDGNAGTMTASGSVTLDPALRYPFEFDLTLRSFRVARRDDVDASASGKVTAKGVLDAAKIVGRLKTETVELRVLDQLPPEVVDLAVVEEGSRAASADRKRQKPEPRFDPVLDIIVEMPGRVFVRGRGIDSEWKGRLALAGTLDDPRISGTINVVRGQMSVIGKVFRVQKGTVVLPESSNAEPEILLTATHEGKRLTAVAHAAGPITKPKITLSSTPDLPQDEIVSQILFNKSAAKLSGIEAAQLAVALAQLSGVGGGGGVVDFARKTLGVDVLRIETSTTAHGDQPSLGAGKYLTEEVYLGVKQGATPESGSVGVEVEVTPNITVESEVRRSGTSDVGVKFKMDY